MSAHSNIIIFDGNCHFCIAVVRFILSHDKTNVFHASPVQEKQARGVLREHGEKFVDLFTVYFISDGKVYKRSTAVFEIAKKMSAPWKWVTGFSFLPVRFTDYLYSLVAKNRFFFGRSETKILKLKEKFPAKFI